MFLDNLNWADEQALRAQAWRVAVCYSLDTMGSSWGRKSLGHCHCHHYTFFLLLLLLGSGERSHHSPKIVVCCRWNLRYLCSKDSQGSLGQLCTLLPATVRDQSLLGPQGFVSSGVTSVSVKPQSLSWEVIFSPSRSLSPSRLWMMWRWEQSVSFIWLMPSLVVVGF